MQYIEILSKLFSFLAPIIKLFQKKYYISENFDSLDVKSEYYPELMASEKMFAFKVSPIPMDSHRTIRDTLSFTLVNKTDKPVKVIAIRLEGKKGKIFPFAPITDELPKVLEPFVGELKTSIIIDQLWALAVYTDKRFTHRFSCLFFFDKLKTDLESVVFKLNEGTLIRHKVSKNLLSEMEDSFNPIPKMHNFPAPETQCSVDECANKPDYVVLLYDHGNNGSIFFEQDYTCPFLCESHMQENERGIGNGGVGERRYPRGVYKYPYSNHYMAQGYTKYAPFDRIETLMKDRA